MIYETPAWLLAFSVARGVHGTEPGVDAREVGLSSEEYEEILEEPRLTTAQT